MEDCQFAQIFDQDSLTELAFEHEVYTRDQLPRFDSRFLARNTRDQKKGGMPENQQFSMGEKRVSRDPEKRVKTIPEEYVTNEKTLESISYHLLKGHISSKASR